MYVHGHTNGITRTPLISSHHQSLHASNLLLLTHPPAHLRTRDLKFSTVAPPVLTHHGQPASLASITSCKAASQVRWVLRGCVGALACMCLSLYICITFIYSGIQNVTQMLSSTPGKGCGSFARVRVCLMSRCQIQIQTIPKPHPS